MIWLGNSSNELELWTYEVLFDELDQLGHGDILA